MKSFRKIVLTVFAVFYLFLTTGITLFKTQCSCTGNSSVSLFAAEKVCDMPEESDSCCGGGESSTASHDDCGCNTPTVNYLKLTDHFGEASGLKYPMPKLLLVIHPVETETFKLFVPESGPIFLPDYSPPENNFFGRYLVNFLNQRKIALFA